MSKELEPLEILKFLVSNYSYFDFDFNNIEKELEVLEIIKELILEDLVFDDKKQAINFSFGISTLCIKIEDKTKYDLLKEALL